MTQSASHYYGRNLQRFRVRIACLGSRPMGGASRGCRGPRRGYLGTAPFPHQQFVIATHGEGHGWRLSVATVPWQGGCERNSSVRLDFGALPGGNCVCSSESVVSEKTGTGPTEDCLEGKDRFADAG